MSLEITNVTEHKIRMQIYIHLILNKICTYAQIQLKELLFYLYTLNLRSDV